MQKNNLQLLATKDGSYTLYDTERQETYHSKFGATAESETVFLHNAGVYKRLTNQQPTAVLEIGFGSGYNFVHTAQHAMTSKCALHYTGLEMRPPPTDLARSLLKSNAPQLVALCDFTCDVLSKALPNSESGDLPFDSLTTLNLVCADALDWALPEGYFDAIYLDAFSIKNNPDLWCKPFLEKLRIATKQGGILATYCVSRSFRDALTSAGYEWQKLPGPKGKREVLTASPTNTPDLTKA